MNCLFVMILFLTIQVNAQFSVGIIAEGTDLITDKNSRMFPLTAVGIMIGYSPAEKFNVEARVSYDFTMLEYQGENYGICLTYDITEPVYVLTNMILHVNDGISDEGIPMKKVVLLGIGAGVNIASFSFELVYNAALQRELWKFSQDVFFQNSWSEKIVGVIKANFKFHWQL